MSQTDRHKASSGKKGRKAQGGETPSPVAPVVPMQARDDADKKAMEVHDGLQDLNRRNGELEVQVGELDGELKKAREAAARAEARASESADKAARVGDLEQGIVALRKQLEQVQTWASEMSAQVATVPELRAQIEKAVEAEKAAREELNLAQERHVTVVRAKDERVAEAEKRARDGMKRLKDAHDSALRDEAARATASEKQAREELKKLQELHEAAMREASPLRTQVAELRVQVEKAGELHKDIDALSQQVGQAVGARDKMRRELDEARSLLNHTREELKNAQDLHDESERGSAGLRMQISDLERKAREAVKEDPRVPALQKDLAVLRDELKKSQDLRGAADRDGAALRTQISDLERKLREIPKEDPRLAPLREELAKAQAAAKDAAALKARAEKAEAAAAESTRYFESIEKELVDALEQADKAEALRAELEKMTEECRDHEEGLDQLAETVMELDHLLEMATKDKPAENPQVLPVLQAPPPAPPPAPKPVVVAPPPSPPVKVEPPAPRPVVVAAPPPLPKPEPIKIELDYFDPPSVSPPAPAPVVVPHAVAVRAPSASSGDTTLRSNNTFGPNGDDGQPIYMLHEVLPKDAMGVMYRATERSSGRAFAVRFMAGQAGEDQTRAFEREVEKLISLPHPNILHVQGTGRRKNRLYVMMDLVDAPTLGAAKVPEIQRICAILRDAASALNYAHEEGIFHGDLNPESIVVAKEDGKDLALVKDFGLACLLDSQTGGLRNPAFLPPEQVRVLKSPLSAAVDVYGLGATLFAALTNRAPFEGKDAVQISKRVMIEEPPPVEKFRPDVPKAVSAVVRRAMAKERGVRFTTAQEMADALSKFLGQ